VVPGSEIQAADITDEAREWRTASGRSLTAVREAPAAAGGGEGRLVLRSDNGRSEANLVEMGRRFAGNVMHVVSGVLLAHKLGGGGGERVTDRNIKAARTCLRVIAG